MNALGIITLAWVEHRYDPMLCKSTEEVNAVVWTWQGSPYLMRRALAHAKTLPGCKVSVWDPTTEDPITAAKMELSHEGGA